MYAVIWLLLTVIQLYEWAVILYVVLMLGMTYRIIDRHHLLVQKIDEALSQLVEPSLRPIRKVVPLMGNFDLSPLVLLLALGFLERLIVSQRFY